MKVLASPLVETGSSGGDGARGFDDDCETIGMSESFGLTVLKSCGLCKAI